MKDTVTIELVHKIFSLYSPEYQQIKKIAEQDLGQELIDRIERFLESRKIETPVKINKVVFEDPSKVRDEDLNDVLDAFVKIRNEETLEEIDRKSIEDILILFNKWVEFGSEEGSLTEELLNLLPENNPETLEAQLTSIRLTHPNIMYELQPLQQPLEIYQQGEIYQPGQEVIHEHREVNPFYQKSEYKIHEFEQ